MIIPFIKRQKRRIGRKFRIIARKDIRYLIGQRGILLPPEHYLPYYQQDFPFYDRYYLEFFKQYGSKSSGLCVIDIGANVGDTALSVLSATQDAEVICIEGSPYFLKYLRLNTSPFSNIHIIDAFVTHGLGRWSLASDGSTGHLVRIDDQGDAVSVGVRTVSPAFVLESAGKGHGPIVWKSDTDGYDIAILLGAFDQIVAACEVIWFEFDPIGNLSEPKDVTELLQRIGTLPRHVVVFDNLGHRLLNLPAIQAPSILEQLTAWLQIQKMSGNHPIRYFDIWLLPLDLADLLVRTTSMLPIHD